MILAGETHRELLPGTVDQSAEDDFPSKLLADAGDAFTAPYAPDTVGVGPAVYDGASTLPLKRAVLSEHTAPETFERSGQLETMRSRNCVHGHRPVPCPITFEGPTGRRERVRISASSSPEAIEHCLRAVFGLPSGCTCVVRDGEGCVAPLDGSLLSNLGNGNTGSASSATAYKVDVVKEAPERVDHRAESFLAPMRRGSARLGQMLSSSSTLGNSSDDEIMATAQEEASFWCSLVGEVRNENSTSSSQFNKPSPSYSSGSYASRDTFFHIANFDTSQYRIDVLYNMWSGPNGKLTVVALRSAIGKHGILLHNDELDKALHVVRRYVRNKGYDSGDDSDTWVTRTVFASMWQRLMLACLCQNEGPEATLAPADVRLIGYNIHQCDEMSMSEREFFFGGNLRFKGGSEDGVSCWACIDNAGPERLVRMGVKFFLHPIATSGSIDAARDGMTKIDVFRHQYFASLEVYALEMFKMSMGKSYSVASSSASTFMTSPSLFFDSSSGTEPPIVSEFVVRSTMFLVATGNPNKGYRDWLLSIVNAELSEKHDPLNRYRSGTEAAVKILDGVRGDLLAHGRLREYQADFLLYTIIDRAASEIVPICKAYGHRLNWLKGQLDAKKLKVPTSHVNEVSNICIELQELRQWIGQLRSVLIHLEEDCKGLDDGGAVSWTFGASANGSGKSLQLFLRGTLEGLTRSTDNLAVLDEMARNFAQDHQRHRDSFMNSTLFVLTVGTVVFMPAQFVAGVYGMNFETEGGDPAFAELRWGNNSYLYFWGLVGGIVLLGSLLAWCLMRH